MTEHAELARAWVRTLRGRGVEVSLRNNRLQLSPHTAFAQLSDAELLFLRHHRAAIKAVVSAAPATGSAPATGAAPAPGAAPPLPTAPAPGAAPPLPTAPATGSAPAPGAAPPPGAAPRSAQLPPEAWELVGLYRENGVVTHALGDEHAQRILRGEISAREAHLMEQRASRHLLHMNRGIRWTPQQ